MRTATSETALSPVGASPACRDTLGDLRTYVEGSLDTDRHRAVERHLGECEECGEQLEAHRKLYTLMDRTIGSRHISRDFDANAERVLRDTPEQVDARTLRRRLPPGAVPAPTYKEGEEIEGDEEEELFIDPPQRSFLDDLQERMGAAPWWIISGAFHALLLLLITLIGMAILRSKDQQLVIVTDLVKKQEIEDLEEPKQRDILRKPVEIDSPEIESELTPVVTHEEVEVAEHLETPDDSDAADARGEDGISDVFLGGSGTVAALGLGGGGGGAFGRPNGAGGRLRRAIRGGGGKATESAVDKALQWLARNQEPDGHWDVQKHEAKDPTDVGVTGLALLAFLGAGHTEKIGKYKDNVRRAQEWLMARQTATGQIGSKFRGGGYCHAVAALALAEGYGMARNPKVGDVAQKAIEYSINVHQHGAKKGSDRSGWRYKAGESPDTSVTGWYVMQLKSAKVAGLQVDPVGFQGAENWLNSVEIEKHNPNDPYSGGTFRYKVNGHTGESITSVGMLSRLFLGASPDTLGGGEKLLLQDLPTWKASSGGKHGAGGGHAMYYWYYGTLSMFQIGKDSWKQWNEALKKSLLPNQCVGGKDDGSWPPLATEGVRGGRVACTALGALCLEVYYRYLPMYRE